MACYKSDLISDLKYIWDNFWQQNDKLILILCGSSPSFLINNIMKSKSLYSRSQYEFPVKELSVKAVGEMFGKQRTKLEVLDAYLAVGGVPEYIKYLKTHSSVFLGLAKRSFVKGGYFVNEAERIFISSFAKSPYYKKIIETLSIHGDQTRNEIQKRLSIPDGGSTTKLFGDLLLCEFIGSYSPISYGKSTRDAKYYVRDNYLQFYYKFIHSHISEIARGDYEDNYSAIFSHHAYRQWLGYAIEKFCLHNHKLIAKILGFSCVQYQVGPYYIKRAKQSAQIDLLFRRKDKTFTVCEIKYQEMPPDMSIIPEFEAKLKLLDKFRNYSIHKVLISPNGVAQSLADSGYFDQIITVEHLVEK